MSKNVTTKRRRKRTRWSDASSKKMSYEDKLAMAGSVLFNSRIANTPLPTKLKANLRFAEKNTFNIGVGGLASTNVYNASSLYDPNSTGVGQQPRGFDQIMEMYRSFTVIGSKITVHFMPEGSNGPILCAINLKSINTVDANIITSVESSYTTFDVTNGVRGPIKLMQTYSPKFVGITNAMDNEELKGYSTGNPIQSSYYHVVVESAGAADEAAFPYFAIIEYTAIFTDPIRPPQS